VIRFTSLTAGAVMAVRDRTFLDMTKRNDNNAGLPLFLSKADVAKATGFSERTIDRRIDDGTLKATRLGPRSIRIERDSVLAWLGQSV
jgi:excisionase family DNA binding protein